MKLIPEEMLDEIPKLYTTENEIDPVARVKLFTPDSNWTWWILEYDGSDLAFGLVKGFETELGYFSIGELESVHGPLGLSVERDLYFQPAKISQIKKDIQS